MASIDTLLVLSSLMETIIIIDTMYNTMMDYASFWKLLNSPDISSNLSDIESQNKNLAILLGSRFDFDSFGSGLALKNICQNAGFTVDIFYFKEVPAIVDEVFGQGTSQDIIVQPNYNLIDFTKYNRLMFCDVPQINFLSVDGEMFLIPTNIESFSIDHHDSNTPFAKNNLAFNRISTCAIIHDLCKALDIEIDAKSAVFLLAGHLTDSGNLSYSGVVAEDFYVAGDLLKISNVSINSITSKLAKIDLLNLKFKGYILSNIKVENDYAYIEYGDLEMEELFGVDASLITASPSDLIRNVKDKKFVYALNQKKESKDGQAIFTISFRSCGEHYDVSRFAKKFGGGGHKAAAGAKFYADDLLSARVQIKNALAEID